MISSSRSVSQTRLKYFGNLNYNFDSKGLYPERGYRSNFLLRIQVYQCDYEFLTLMTPLIIVNKKFSL